MVVVEEEVIVYLIIWGILAFSEVVDRWQAAGSMSIINIKAST